MDKDEKKMLAFLTGMVAKLSDGEQLDTNERQQLDNILCELGYYQLDTNEFRW